MIHVFVLQFLAIFVGSKPNLTAYFCANCEEFICSFACNFCCIFLYISLGNISNDTWSRDFNNNIKNNSFPLAKDKNKYIPNNVHEWLEKGHSNEKKYQIKRTELFTNKLFIFIDNKLLNMHSNIIKQCNGNIILCQKNNIKNKIENEIKYRNDIKEYAIFNDTNNKNNRNKIIILMVIYILIHHQLQMLFVVVNHIQMNV